MSKFVTLHGFGGSGSADLNFEVIAYESEEALLASTPAENTVGIITTTPITSWIFSATEPVQPASDMVWIPTSTSSSVEFNALKQNGVQVYPISAKQYVNGAWADVTAMSYQNGGWIKWETKLVLFDNGQTVPWVAKAGSSTGQARIGNTIVFTYSDPSGAWTCAGTSGRHDLSKYNTLYFDMNITSHYNYFGGDAVVGVIDQAPYTSQGAISFKASTQPKVDGVRRTVSVDISSINSGYIAIYGILNATIYKVWCEK